MEDLGLVAFFGVWIGFAIYGIKKKMSEVTAIGGGLLIAISGLIAIGVAKSWIREGGPDIFSSIQSVRLESQALAKLDSIGLDFFCSKVIDRKLTNVSIGTSAGGKSGTARFPAIKANYSGTCIEVLNGDRDKEMVKQFWVFFALDDEADTLRCYKISNDKEDLDTHAAECKFKV